MLTLEAGKSSVSGDIDMEDAKDIGNRLGKKNKRKIIGTLKIVTHH